MLFKVAGDRKEMHKLCKNAQYRFKSAIIFLHRYILAPLQTQEEKIHPFILKTNHLNPQKVKKWLNKRQKSTNKYITR